MAKPSPTPAHAFAEIFPLHASGESFDSLVASIKKLGLRKAIVLDPATRQILDGRRRELACFAAGAKPRYRLFGSHDEDGHDMLEFVFVENYERRHLTDGERKISAGRYATARRGRRPTDGEADGERAPTNAEAAAKFDVSVADVKRAKKVDARCSTAVITAVCEDVVALADANAIAEEPKWLQNAAVRKLRAGKYQSLKAAVEALRPQPGDGRESTRSTAPKGAKAPKSGAVIFEWKTYEKALGALVRLVDSIADAYGEKRPHFERITADTALGTFSEAMKRWRAALEKGVA